MILEGSRGFRSSRLNTIVRSLTDVVREQRPLTFADRLPQVSAGIDEIYGTFSGRAFIADLIAHGQAAVVYSAGEVTMRTTSVPKSKIGAEITERQALRMLNGPAVDGQDAERDYEMTLAERLLLGLRQRRNQLAVAMLMDDLTYNRYGIKISGMTWGKPSALKVTVATPWSSSSSADPINDLLSLRDYASETYGIIYDRVTMRRGTFQEMIACTKFASQLSLTVKAMFQLDPSDLPVSDVNKMLEIATSVLGMEIVLDSGTFSYLTGSGATHTHYYLDEGAVIMDTKSNDGNASIWDFASVPVMESAQDVLQNVLELESVSEGPISYYTGNEDLNPPNAVAWAVESVFPRFHQPEASAYLLV